MPWLIVLFTLLGTPSDGPPAAAWDPAQLAPVAVPEASPLAMQFYRSGTRLWFVVQGWSLLVPALIVFSGLSGRMRDLARRAGRTWYGTIAVYALLYLGLTYLIDLPLDYYLGYVRSHEYGLSHQGFGRWLGEGLKSLAVTAVAAVALLWIPYLVLARSPRRWWIWTAMLTLPFALGGAMIKPIWIDPLFNSFAPMKDKGLEAKILAMAGRAGIAADHVFEVDKSRDTRTLNAYVTGLLGTKRIVLWDTLLARLDDKEVLAIMGHEMGHYVLNHVAWGVSLATAGSFLLLAIVHLTARWLIARLAPRLGFDSLADVASVPLLVFLLGLFNLIGAPVQLAVSRAMEHEADRFALEITRMNRSAATSFAKIVDDNLANPRPDGLSIFWRSTHPPIGERIDFCNLYHPWTEGLPGRYEGRFLGPAPPPR